MRVLGALAPQTGDTTAPTTPQNVVATAINAGRVDLSWTASTDDFGVSGYQLFRNGLPLNTTTLTSYTDSTCQPSTLYSYVIVAFDGAGNNSGASNSATATTPANAAPVWQSIPAQTLIIGNAYLLELTSFCTDADLDTITFSITAGTLPTGIVLSGTRLQGTPTTAGQTPTVTVRAADAFHQISTTIAFSTKTADVTAPPVPTGLAVAVVSTSQLNVSWSASVDVAGGANELVTGTQDYRLYRDGVLRTTITSPTLTYSDTGLAAGTTYGYKITARDQNNNESAQSATVSGTTQATGLFNPNYPRFGSYALGGTQNASNSALAQIHVNIIPYYPGWEASRGTLQSKALAVKAASTIGSMIIPYTITVDALDAWGTPPQANWEWYNQLTANQWFVYSNGLTHTGKVVGSQTGWSKPNYTTFCPLVAGDTAARWKAKWDFKLLYTGGTFSNGSNNLTVTACNAIDGKFDDNIFARERSAGDYNVDGTSEAVADAANISLIQSSHGTNADYWRTLAPSGSMLLANSADWPIWYPAGVTGLAFDQKYDGGILENLEEWVNGVRGSTMSTLLNAIKVQLDGFRGSKLGVMDVTVSSATNYSSLRWWHAVSALTGAYLYTHLTSGLLAEELGTINYDERTFSLGAAIDPVQWTPRYQSGTNGTGIYRRDFANGIVLAAAPTGTYSAVSLGGTFYRLNGTLDPTTNNAATVTSVTLSAGQALVLARVSQATVTPLYIGTFDTGTVGQPCNTEYSAFNSGSTPVIYSSDVTGPKGEAKVGKIQLATGNSYYGGAVRLPRPINSQQGQEFWARSFIRLRSAFCCGGAGNVESVNGSLKFWRWFFDGNNRLTLLLGNPDSSSGAFIQGGCANPATAPILGLFNSEVGTQNLFMNPTNLVMTRDTWISICLYILWGTSNTGRVRCWFNDTLVLNSACSTRPVGSQYDTVAQGFSWPGDYYNGQPQTSEAMGFISQAIILDSTSVPPWFDPANPTFRYIPSSIDVRTL